METTQAPKKQLDDFASKLESLLSKLTGLWLRRVIIGILITTGVSALGIIAVLLSVSFRLGRIDARLASFTKEASAYHEVFKEIRDSIKESHKAVAATVGTNREIQKDVRKIVSELKAITQTNRETATKLGAITDTLGGLATDLKETTANLKAMSKRLTPKDNK